MGTLETGERASTADHVGEHAVGTRNQNEVLPQAVRTRRSEAEELWPGDELRAVPGSQDARGPESADRRLHLRLREVTVERDVVDRDGLGVGPRFAGDAPLRAG